MLKNLSQAKNSIKKKKCTDKKKVTQSPSDNLDGGIFFCELMHQQVDKGGTLLTSATAVIKPT